MELSFNFGGDIQFIDKETDERIITHPHQIKKAYQEAMISFIENIKKECSKLGIEYNLVETNTSYDRALWSFFKKRGKLN